MKKLLIFLISALFSFSAFSEEVTSISSGNDASENSSEVADLSFRDLFGVSVSGTFKFTGGSKDLEWYDTDNYFIDGASWDAGFETVRTNFRTPLGNFSYEFSPGFTDSDYSYSSFRYLPFTAVLSMASLAEAGHEWAETATAGLMLTLPTYGYEKTTTPSYEATDETFGLYLNVLTFRTQDRLYSNINSDFGLHFVETYSKQFGLFTSEVLKTISEMWLQYATLGDSYILDAFPGVQLGSWNVLPAPIFDIYYQNTDYTFSDSNGNHSASASGWSGSLGASVYAISNQSSLLDLINYRLMLTAYYQKSIALSEVDESNDLPGLVGEEFYESGSDYFVQLHLLASF